MMTRAFKRSVCRVLIGVLLFAQFAVAAHACQNLAKNVAGSATMDMVARDTTAASSSMAATSINADEGAPSPCGDMGDTPAQTGGNVCIEHCRYGEQVSDSGQLPAVSPCLFAVLYLVPALLPAESARLMPAEMRVAPVATSPPHAILHCCLRT